VFLDQVTKVLVRSRLELGDIWLPSPSLDGLFQIIHWKNTGMFLGVLEGFGILFTLLAIAVACAGIYFFPRVPKEDWPLRLGISLQLGGVIGNLLDRLTVGYVTDFISIGRLPIMNLADLALYLGLAILALSVLLKPERKKPQAGATRQDSQL
jgi:signal peptidase II